MKVICWAFTVLALVSVSACATTSRYEAKVRSWQGQDAKALVQAWGQPDDKQPVHGGNTMYIYARLHHPAVAYNGTQREIASVGESHELANIYQKCATFFEVDPRDKIVATDYRGDECKSRD